MNKLFIDTSNNERIVVGLEVNGEKDEVVKEVDKRKSQVVLSLINSLLTKHKLKPAELTGIEVSLGPGSFTGLRVGVAIANALGVTLHIPVNNNPVGKTVEPIYQ